MHLMLKERTVVRQAVEHGAEDTARDLIRLVLSTPERMQERAGLTVLLESPAALVPCSLLVLAHLIREARRDLDATIAAKPRTLKEATKPLAGELVVMGVAPNADVVTGRKQHEPFALTGEPLGLGKLFALLSECPPLPRHVVEDGACRAHRLTPQRRNLLAKVRPQAAHLGSKC